MRTPLSSTATGPEAATALSAGVGHYENFPVASWLCPAHLRPAVMAIYHYARTADDIADEGDASPEQRLADLGAYRTALNASLSMALNPAENQPPCSGPWPSVFGPLARAIAHHQLPAQPLHDLLSAFEQDVRHTASGHRYRDEAELLAYCALSANPVGRLMLHLHGVDDPQWLARSDDICSALQLVNFWQDLGRDLPRGRCYLPLDGMARHGVGVGDFQPPSDTAATSALVAELCEHARQLMHHGAPLALDLPGRFGWELRLVVQGGLCILDKIAAGGHRPWLRRPWLTSSDLPRLLWQALRMAAPATPPQ